MIIFNLKITLFIKNLFNISIKYQMLFNSLINNIGIMDQLLTIIIMEKRLNY
jgi:hypothetical protein